ncbi:hypothetical protein GE09DRAFT_515258 [Coniochaeta sp. 2T2.1]|nr:hypothetical protein GE09DRAFT_515258 [Coniochaeta sp. 2T2.1]
MPENVPCTRLAFNPRTISSGFFFYNFFIISFGRGVFDPFAPFIRLALVKGMVLHIFFASSASEGLLGFLIRCSYYAVFPLDCSKLCQTRDCLCGGWFEMG